MQTKGPKCQEKGDDTTSRVFFGHFHNSDILGWLRLCQIELPRRPSHSGMVLLVQLDLAASRPAQNVGIMKMASFSNPEFEAIKQKYKDDIPNKLNELDQLIEAAQHSMQIEIWTALRMAVHKLAGNAGIFGYTEVSGLCKLLDQKITQKLEKLPQAVPDAAWLATLNVHLQEIRNAFQRAK